MFTVAETIRGQFDFFIRIWGLKMASVKGTFTIHVNPAVVPPLVLIPVSGALPDETVGEQVTGGVTASGGTGAVTFAVTQGALPDGVSLDPNTGSLSGTPTVAGDATIEITATDSAPVQ